VNPPTEPRYFSDRSGDGRRSSVPGSIGKPSSDCWRFVIVGPPTGPGLQVRIDHVATLGIADAIDRTIVSYGVRDIGVTVANIVFARNGASCPIVAVRALPNRRCPARPMGGRTRDQSARRSGGFPIGHPDDRIGCDCWSGPDQGYRSCGVTLSVNGVDPILAPRYRSMLAVEN
jgi:hypothetical protein